MKNFILLVLFLVSQVFAGTEAIVKVDQADGLESLKNYMKEKAHFEKSVNGWVAYADAAQRLPVDGTGGAPTVTCTRSSTTPITGDGSLIITKTAVNSQGQGCAAQFTIDNSAKAKVLQIELDYRVVSGTFVAGTDTTDSDLILYMYDVTNSTLIEPTSIKFRSNSTTLPDKMVANFQTSATGTTYNLILHAATTSASAYVMMVDNVKVMQSRYIYGTPITDWASYTPTFTGFGTASNVNFRSRRVGDSLEVMGSFQAGTPTATLAQITLGYGGGNANVTSASWLTSGGQVVGHGNNNASITTNFSGITAIAQPSLNYINLGNESSTLPGVQSLNGNTLVNTSGIIHLNFIVPISGWSATTQVSEGYNTRDIVLDARNVSGTIATSAATWTTLTFTTPFSDTTGSWNGSDTWTNPTSGWYRLKILASQNSAASAYFDVGYRISGGSDVLVARGVGGATFAAVVSGTDTVYLTAGQTIQARALTEGTQGINLRRLTIERAQSPQTMSADAKMTFMAEGASSGAAGSNVVIPFNNPVEDTHVCWNSANKDCTVPSPGTYKVTCATRVAPTGPTVNQYIDVIIQIDTVTKREFVKYLENTGIAALSGMASWQGPLIAGQKIRCVLDTNLTSPVMTTGTTHTYMEISRIK